MRAGGRLRFVLLCLVLGLAAGCRNRDLLENELRHREELYRDALDEQRKAECRVESLQREVEVLRQGQPKLSPEQAALSLGVKRITLGRATGGYDKDGLPGDELLQVVVEPRDCDDHVIKAPGTLQICALEITPQGLKLPLCTWQLGPEELSKTWKQGLLSTGYTLFLPWKQQPHSEMVRVTVRLIVADSRVYETDKDVKVRCVPGLPPRPPDVSAEPVPAETLDTLPPPRPVFPGTAPPAEPFLFPSSRATPTPGEEHRAARPAPNWAPPERRPVRIGRPAPLASDEPH
jgi:hypothetical protein